MAKYNITGNWVPNIREFRKFVEIVEGIDVKTLKMLYDQIEDARGTPQEPRDWRDPSSWIPKLRDLLPKEKQRETGTRVYNKELDGLWKTNLPLVGEIQIPIEIQF